MTIGLRTLGTTANNSLTAIQFSHVADGEVAQAFPNRITPAALAALTALMKFDVQGALSNQDFDPNAVQPNFGMMTAHGQLVIPARGVLKVKQGDIVAVDTQTGWPILLSAAAAASNPAWVLSAVSS